MKISKKDWAQLSAFLDGELSQRDSSKLQVRIDANPDFQAALEDLRNLKAVLSHTPHLPVPRNFALRRSQVEAPQRRAPVRGYSLAAAALSFLFIGVVVLDFGSGALKGGLSASEAPRAEEVMLEAAFDEMEESAPLAKEAVEEEIAPSVEMEEAAEAQEEVEAALEGETLGMEEDATKAAEEADRAAGAEGEYYGEESPEVQNLLTEDEEAEPEEAWVAPDEDPGSVVEAPEIPWMRILEITFGLGAVGFGAAALVKRRKDRQ